MNFFIIHGVYANPEANWFPWLKKELEEKGYEAIVPKFPTPLNQNLDSWLRTIKSYENKINNDTIMIGHSLGSAFILNYLEQTSKKIRAAFLVAEFFKMLNTPYDELNKSFIDRDFDWKKIRKNCGKFFIIASDNDKYIPLEMNKELAKNLNSELRIVNNGGHLNKESGYDRFPLLLELILKDNK